MTAEDVVEPTAAECAFVDERGAVDIRLKTERAPLARLVEQLSRP
jgi:hypothetical protein